MPWRYVVEWRYSFTILDLGTRLRLMVSFTPRQLYSRRNCPLYPMDMRLDGPQDWSGRWEEKNLAPVGMRTPVVQPIARRYIDRDIPTEKRERRKKAERNEIIHLVCLLNLHQNLNLATSNLEYLGVNMITCNICLWWYTIYLLIFWGWNVLSEWLWNLDLLLSVFGCYHDQFKMLWNVFGGETWANAKLSNGDLKNGLYDQ
jgi:hypothetical protein